MMPSIIRSASCSDRTAIRRGMRSVSAVAETPGFNICDWTRETRALPNERVELTLTWLASHDCGDCALFLPAKSPLTAHPNWATAEAASLVLEERLLTPDTLPPVLRYLEATTDLADRPNFLAQPGFVESFDDLLDDRKAGLCDAMRLRPIGPHSDGS
jgi:hypothetical protein